MPELFYQRPDAALHCHPRKVLHRLEYVDADHRVKSMISIRQRLTHAHVVGNLVASLFGMCHDVDRSGLNWAENTDCRNRADPN